MNGYKLSRKWWDFTFENPEKIKPNHTALYFFIIEHSNRMGWKTKFGLPTTMAKEAIGIRSYNTYSSTLSDLVNFGFITMVEKSKNQYSSNIVALSNYDKALDKALDKASIKHGTKQGESTLRSTIQSISSINKPLTYNLLTENIERIAENLPQVIEFLDSQNSEPQKNLPKNSVDVFPADGEKIPLATRAPDFSMGLDNFRENLKKYLAASEGYAWSSSDTHDSKAIFLKLKESYPDANPFEEFKKLYKGLDGIHAQNFDLKYFLKYYNRINGQSKRVAKKSGSRGTSQSKAWAQRT